MRGPVFALYGNSFGSVIKVFTESGEAPPRIESSFMAGSNGQRRYGLKASGSNGDGAGALDYVVSLNRYSTDGYRDHSSARKNLGNAKLGVALSDDSKLTVI